MRLYLLKKLLVEQTEKLFLKNKRQGYKAVNFDNNDTFHIRNLIFRNSDILKVLKDNDEIEYGCLGIRADLYESQSVEMGNFSFDSAMLKFGLPLIFQLKNNFDRYKDKKFQTEFSKDEVEISGAIKNASLNNNKQTRDSTENNNSKLIFKNLFKF